MLTGTADPDALAAGPWIATVEGWASDDVMLEGVTALQLLAELRRADRETLVPPGLHPTDPPSLHIQWWQVSDSPWGPFTWCHTRLSCRSGARARALTTAWVDRAEAGRGLAERFGFPCRQGQVRLSAFYDRCSAQVSVDGVVTLHVAALDPTPMALDAVQATSTLNLARTPFGLRLVQVEARRRTTRVERVRAAIGTFDPSSWGRDQFDPYHVVGGGHARRRDQPAGCAVRVPPRRRRVRGDRADRPGRRGVTGATLSSSPTFPPPRPPIAGRRSRCRTSPSPAGRLRCVPPGREPVPAPARGCG